MSGKRVSKKKGSANDVPDMKDFVGCAAADKMEVSAVELAEEFAAMNADASQRMWAGGEQIGVFPKEIDLDLVGDLPARINEERRRLQEVACTLPHMDRMARTAKVENSLVQAGLEAAQRLSSGRGGGVSGGGPLAAVSREAAAKWYKQQLALLGAQKRECYKRLANHVHVQKGTGRPLHAGAPDASNMREFDGAIEMLDAQMRAAKARYVDLVRNPGSSGGAFSGGDASPRALSPAPSPSTSPAKVGRGGAPAGLPAGADGGVAVEDLLSMTRQMCHRESVCEQVNMYLAKVRYLHYSARFPLYEAARHAGSVREAGKRGGEDLFQKLSGRQNRIPRMLRLESQVMNCVEASRRDLGMVADGDAKDAFLQGIKIPLRETYSDKDVDEFFFQASAQFRSMFEGQRKDRELRPYAAVLDPVERRSELLERIKWVNDDVYREFTYLREGEDRGVLESLKSLGISPGLEVIDQYQMSVLSMQKTKGIDKKLEVEFQMVDIQEYDEMEERIKDLCVNHVLVASGFDDTSRGMGRRFMKLTKFAIDAHRLNVGPVQKSTDDIDIDETESLDPIDDRKLFLYYVMRNLQMRRAKQRILERFNLMHAIKRRLASDLLEQDGNRRENGVGGVFATRDPMAGLGMRDGVGADSADAKTAEVWPEGTSSESPWSATDVSSGSILRDLDGLKVMYKEAVSDMEQVEEEMLLAGSFYIHRRRERNEAKSEEQRQAASDRELSNMVSGVIDRGAMASDLYTLEERFSAKKLELVKAYLVCYENIVLPEKRREMAQIILDVMVKRPRLDLYSRYYTASYMTELEVLENERNLVCDVMAHLSHKESHFRENLYASSEAEAEAGGGIATGVITPLGLPLRNYKSATAVFPLTLPHPRDKHAAVPGELDTGLLDFNTNLETIITVKKTLAKALNDLTYAHHLTGASRKACAEAILLERCAMEWKVAEDEMAHLQAMNSGMPLAADRPSAAAAACFFNHSSLSLTCSPEIMIQSVLEAVRAAGYGDIAADARVTDTEAESEACARLHSMMYLRYEVRRWSWECVVLEHSHRVQAAHVGLSIRHRGELSPLSYDSSKPPAIELDFDEVKPEVGEAQGEVLGLCNDQHMPWLAAGELDLSLVSEQFDFSSPLAIANTLMNSVALERLRVVAEVQAVQVLAIQAAVVHNCCPVDQTMMSTLVFKYSLIEKHNKFVEQTTVGKHDDFLVTAMNLATPEKETVARMEVENWIVKEAALVRQYFHSVNRCKGAPRTKLSNIFESEVLDMIRKSGIKNGSTDPRDPAVRMLKAQLIGDYCSEVIEELNHAFMQDQLLQSTRRIGYIGFNLPFAGTDKNPIMPSATNAFLSRTLFTYWGGEHKDNLSDWTLANAMNFVSLPRVAARSTFYFKPMSDPLVMDKNIIVPNHWVHIYEEKMSSAYLMNAAKILNVLYEILALSIPFAKFGIGQPEIFDPFPEPLSHVQEMALLEVPNQIVRGLGSIRRYQFEEGLEYLESYRKRQLLNWMWTATKFRDQLAANDDQASAKMVSWVLRLIESETHLEQMDMYNCLWEYFAFSLPNLNEPARNLLTKEKGAIAEKLEELLKESNTFRESNPLGAETIMLAYLESQLVLYRFRGMYLSVVHGVHDMPTSKEEREIATRCLNHMQSKASGVVDDAFADNNKRGSSKKNVPGGVEVVHLTQVANLLKKEIDSHFFSTVLEELGDFLIKYKGGHVKLRSEGSVTAPSRAGRGSPRFGQSPRTPVGRSPSPGPHSVATPAGSVDVSDFEKTCSVFYTNMIGRLRGKSRNLRKDGSFILMEDELKDEVYLFVRSAKEAFDSIISQSRANSEEQQKALRQGFQRTLDHIEYLKQLREEDKLRRAININAGVVDSVASVIWERDSLRKKMMSMVEIMEEKVVSARDATFKECEDRMAELEANNIFLRNSIKIQRESIVQEIMEGLGDIKKETVEKMVELVKKVEAMESAPGDDKGAERSARISRLETEVELLKDENVTTMHTILKLKSMYQVKSAAASLQSRKVTRKLASNFKIGNKQFWDNRDSAERKEEIMQAQLDDLRVRSQGTESALEKARREIKVAHEAKMKLLKWKTDKTQEIAEKDALIENYKRYTNTEMRQLVKRLQERNAELETMLGLDGRVDRRNTAMEGTLQVMTNEMKKLQQKVNRERTGKLEAYNRLLFLELAPEGGVDGDGDSVMDGGDGGRPGSSQGRRQYYQPLLTARTTAQEDVLRRRHTTALTKVQSLEHKCSLMRRALREVHVAGGSPDFERIVGKEVMELVTTDDVPLTPRPTSVGYGQVPKRPMSMTTGTGTQGARSAIPHRPSSLHHRSGLSSGASSRAPSAGRTKVRSVSVPDVIGVHSLPRPATVAGNQK